MLLLTVVSSSEREGDIYQNEVKKYRTYFVFQYILVSVYSSKYMRSIIFSCVLAPVSFVLWSGWASITTTAVERLGGV